MFALINRIEDIYQLFQNIVLWFGYKSPSYKNSTI